MLKKILTLFSFVIILSSCLNVTNEINLNEDLSGSIKTTLVLDKVTASLIDDPNQDIKKVPMTKDAVKKFENDNLTLKNFTSSDSEEEGKSVYVFDFKNILDLNKLSVDSPISIDISTSKEGANNVISYGIVTQKAIDVMKAELKKRKKDQIEVAKTVLSDYGLTIILNAPSKIKSSSLGTVSGNKVIYKTTFDKFLAQNTPLYIKVVF